MAENSAIEWTDHTFNPWEGCQKVGPGCDHCYAESRNARFGGGTAPNWGAGAPRRRTSPANWRKPLRWQADATRFLAEHGRRQRVFCASLADVFDNAVEDMWRAELANLISDTPDLDWLLLTKRIGNVEDMLQIAFDGATPSNVWLGATIVNQVEADRDIPKLLTAPAAKRFLSVEPLLGPIDLSQVHYCDDDGDELIYGPLTGKGVMSDLGYYHQGEGPWEELNPGVVPTLDWVIVGGESGPGARPMHPDWARSLRDQCAVAGVPFLFKQWGEWAPGENSPNTVNQREVRTADWFDGTWLLETMHGNVELHADDEPTLFWAGKKAAGRLLDGVKHDGVPA